MAKKCTIDLSWFTPDIFPDINIPVIIDLAKSIAIVKAVDFPKVKEKLKLDKKIEHLMIDLDDGDLMLIINNEKMKYDVDKIAPVRDLRFLEAWVNKDGILAVQPLACNHIYVVLAPIPE